MNGGQLVPIMQDVGSRMKSYEGALAGSGMNAKRFGLACASAWRRDGYLQNADRNSFLSACQQAAQDQLYPDGREGALVAFDGKVIWMPMVLGIRKKVRRSGEMKDWRVAPVFERDEFDYNLGDDPYVKHKPYLAPRLARLENETSEAYTDRLRQHQDKGVLTHVYSIAEFNNGHISYDVMTLAEVLHVRDTYAKKNKYKEFSRAWRFSFPEMAAKTVAHHHAKQLPMPDDLRMLLTRDEGLYDLSQDREPPRQETAGDLSARLDSLVDSGADYRSSGEGEDQPRGDNVSPSLPEGETATEIASPPVVVGPGASPSASGTPPGDTEPPSETPGGTPTSKRKREKEPDLLAQPLRERGMLIAKQGSKALEDWIRNMQPDDQAHTSLLLMKEWRAIAEQTEGAPNEHA